MLQKKTFFSRFLTLENMHPQSINVFYYICVSVGKKGYECT